LLKFRIKKILDLKIMPQNNNKKIVFFILILLATVGYVVFKSITKGADIDIYLNSAQNLYLGNNLYPTYLYSPFSALLFLPLSFLRFEVARIIWSLLNLVFLIRLWNITKIFLDTKYNFSQRQDIFWNIFTLIISFGSINHNIILGQTTILILWLSLESMYQIFQKKYNKGAFLLALGIIIKILPIFFIYYLFLKGRYKTIFTTIVFVLIMLVVPAFFVGYQKNVELHKAWFETINPQNERFVFENNNGCQSLNTILPVYFYKFDKENLAEKYNFSIKIAYLDYDTLVYVLNIVRVLLLISFLFIVLLRRKERLKLKIFYFWEISYLLLITILIFPHQMKYSMLLFVPAACYIIFYYVFKIYQKIKFNIFEKILFVFSSIVLLIVSFSGRDIVGKYLSGFFDYFHFQGLAVILFLIFLALSSPLKIQRYLKNIR